jgi:integrase
MDYKTYRKNKTKDTKKEVEEYYRAFTLAIDNNSDTKRDDRTVQDALREYVISLEEVKIKTSTMEYYNWALRRLFNPHDLDSSVGKKGNMYQRRLGSIKHKDMTRSFAVLKDQKNYAARSYRGIKKAGSAFFNWCIAQDYLDKNPLAKVKIPENYDEMKNKVARNRRLDKDEMRDLREAIRGDRLELFMLLLMNTGARKGEIRSVKNSDILVESCRINIDKTYNRYNYRDHRGLTTEAKTKNAIRQIPITRGLMDQIVQAMKVSKLKKKGDFFFAGPTGKPLSDRALKEGLKRFNEACKFEHPFTWHSIRHTHASELIEFGVSEIVLKDRLGHADFDFLRLTYVDLDKEFHEEATKVHYL